MKKLIKTVVFIGFFTLLLGKVFLNEATAQALPVGLTGSVVTVNETKNLDASSVEASREDFISVFYGLTNGTTTTQAFAPNFDLAQVLPIADYVSSEGGSLQGSRLVFSQTTFLPGEFKEFKVKFRVKYSLPPFAYELNFINGEEVLVKIESLLAITGKPGYYIAPQVGSEKDMFLALILASGLTMAVFVLRNKQLISRQG